MMRDYLTLTKPGIVRGNLVAAIAGFFLASQTQFVAATFLAMTLGLSMIIASSCVFNNILDRSIDALMKRTKRRPLITGAVPVMNAYVFGSFLLIGGSYVLAMFTTWLATIAALLGVVLYVGVYGYAKRTTSHSTLIGSISGAVPPVVGYTSVTGSLDVAAWLLFVIMVFWQMPHFYAIAMFRSKEYATAKLPILTVKKNVAAAVRPMIVYLIGYIVASLLLITTGLVGAVYVGVMLLVSAYWLYKALSELSKKTPDKWAKMMFGLSLLALIAQSLAIVIDVTTRQLL